MSQVVELTALEVLKNSLEKNISFKEDCRERRIKAHKELLETEDNFHECLKNIHEIEEKIWEIESRTSENIVNKILVPAQVHQWRTCFLCDTAIILNEEQALPDLEKIGWVLVCKECLKQKE